MADYTPIDPNSLLPGQPITSALGQALEENPRAQQDFASGAPINVGIWHPFDADEYGESDGLLYDHAADGNVSEIETPVFDAGYEYKIAFENMRRSNTTGSFFDARITSTSSYLNIADALDAGISGRPRFSGEIISRRPFQIAHVKVFDRVTLTAPSSSFVDEVSPDFRAQTDAVLVSRSTATAVDRMRLRAATGSFESGKVWLMRRKVEGF